MRWRHVSVCMPDAGRVPVRAWSGDADGGEGREELPVERPTELQKVEAAESAGRQQPAEKKKPRDFRFVLFRTAIL